MSETQEPLSPRLRTFLMVGMAMAVLGIALSAYTLNHHFAVKASGVTDAACNINATFNCDDVARSRYAEPFGIPMGVFGLGYFGALLVLLGTVLFKPAYKRDNVQTYAVLVVSGLAVSIALAGISKFAIGVFCVVCMGVYATTILQAGALYVFRKEIPGPFTGGALSNGGTFAFAVFAVVVLVFNVLRPPEPSPALKRDERQTEEVLNRDRGANAVLAANKVDLPLNLSAFSGYGEDLRAGSDDAKVVIVEFADFQCPACGQASKGFRDIKKEYGNQILFVFKNYPLDSTCNSGMNRKMHEWACPAATLVRCAMRIGKGWEMHDIAFDRQKDMSAANLKAWGHEVGLTDAQMDECAASKDILSKIQDDVALGNKVGVDSTPTVFVNGRKVVGDRSVEALREEINRQLGQ